MAIREETESIDLFSYNLSKKSKRLLLDMNIKWFHTRHIIILKWWINRSIYSRIVETYQNI